MAARESMATLDDTGLLSAFAQHAERRREGDDEAARDDVFGRVRSPAAVLNSTVEYEDLESAARSRVTLAHPTNADVGRGRISVLSPVGRALLGRRIGHVAEVTLPSGDVRRLAIIAIHEDG